MWAKFVAWFKKFFGLAKEKIEAGYDLLDDKLDGKVNEYKRDDLKK